MHLCQKHHQKLWTGNCTLHLLDPTKYQITGSDRKFIKLWFSFLGLTSLAASADANLDTWDAPGTEPWRGIIRYCALIGDDFYVNCTWLVLESSFIWQRTWPVQGRVHTSAQLASSECLHFSATPSNPWTFLQSGSKWPLLASERHSTQATFAHFRHLELRVSDICLEPRSENQFRSSLARRSDCLCDEEWGFSCHSVLGILSAMGWVQKVVHPRDSSENSGFCSEPNLQLHLEHLVTLCYELPEGWCHLPAEPQMNCGPPFMVPSSFVEKEVAPHKVSRLIYWIKRDEQASQLPCNSLILKSWPISLTGPLVLVQQFMQSMKNQAFFVHAGLEWQWNK